MIDLARSDLRHFYADRESGANAVDVFGFERHGRQVGTALFREIIGAKLDVEPTSVRIERDASGRPYAADSDVYFNCSWSGTLAVFAISKLQPVGVDLEIPGADRFPDSLSESILSSRERRTFARLAAARRPGWLARAWTCKEAVVKGLGCGLQLHPASISVAPPEDLLPEAPGWHAREARNFPPWWLAELHWAGAAIALAVLSRPGSLRFVSLVP